MRTFSRLNVLTLLFLSIALVLIEGTVDAQSLEVYTADEQAGYGIDIGEPVKATFVVDPPKAVRLRIDAVGVKVTSISGASAPYAIPGNYPTDADAGILIVEGIITSSGAYISARWDGGANNDLYARADLPNAVDSRHLAVFHKYRDTFQHPDVHEHFPDVLRAFKKPDIQNVLNPVVIHHFVRDPGYIRAFYPNVDESLITLLATDNGFRTLFGDEEFQGVLQEPTGIDDLVGLIEAQSPPQVPRMLTIVSGDLQEEGAQTTLGNPLVVLVRDQYGEPLSGVDVTFRATRGGGSLSHTTARTNSAGRAETTLTLASEPGIHQVEASVVGFPSLTQTFTAAAECKVPEPSRAITLSIVSGNDQSGEVDKPLAQPFVVGVLDQEGKPLQGTAVTFTVTAGPGRLSGQVERTIVTDVYGQARTTLTLGAGAGRHSVMARAVGITQTQTFTATADASLPPEAPMPVVSVQPSTAELSLPPMYWIAGNTIYHRPTGGEKETFLEPQDVTLTGGLAVDTIGRKVYWTEEKSDGTGRVRSADLDGSNVETVQGIKAVPYNIAVGTDMGNKRWVYWTNSYKKIQRIRVDGSDFQGNFMVFPGSPTPPHHIAFDQREFRLYWTEMGRIRRVTANGKGKRETIVEDLGELGGYREGKSVDRYYLSSY